MFFDVGLSVSGGSVLHVGVLKFGQINALVYNSESSVLLKLLPFPYLSFG